MMMQKRDTYVQHKRTGFFQAVYCLLAWPSNLQEDDECTFSPLLMCEQLIQSSAFRSRRFLAMG